MCKVSINRAADQRDHVLYVGMKCCLVNIPSIIRCEWIMPKDGLLSVVSHCAASVAGGKCSARGGVLLISSARTFVIPLPIGNKLTTLVNLLTSLCHGNTGSATSTARTCELELFILFNYLHIQLFTEIWDILSMMKYVCT